MNLPAYQIGDSRPLTSADYQIGRAGNPARLNDYQQPFERHQGKGQ